jgi:DNA polymerase III subunit alpha
VQGRVQADKFSGGSLRLTAGRVWNLAGARARFGRFLRVAVNGGMPPVAELIRTWPAQQLHTDEGTVVQGLPVRLRLHRDLVAAELDLGDDSRFWPSDEALARWGQVAHAGQAEIVYAG